MTQSQTSFTQDTESGIRLPNFLIIGAAKSGTTSLHHYLSQHPEVFMSPFKEPQFFAYEGQRLSGFSGDWIPQNYKNVGIEYRDPYNLDTYQQLFRGVQDEVAIGEASTYYLYRSETIANIKKHIPNAKLVAILRHPADRAFSQFSMMRSTQTRESLKEFSAALAAEPERIAANWVPDWHYTQLGFYHRQLKPYYEAFGAENMFVCLYDDLKRDPEKLLEDLFSFLGVDETFKPDTEKRHNVSGSHPRNDHVHNLMKTPHPFKTALRSVLPERVYQKAAEAVLRWNQAKPTLSPRVRRELTQLYRDDILLLQDLIGRDLSHWLELPKKERKS